jgi:hypothetical protein
MSFLILRHADLVRDVMTARCDEAEGGMMGLQREVLRLFVAALDQHTELRAKFDKLDVEGQGKLTRDQSKLQPKQFDQAQKKKNGTIDFPEFATLYKAFDIGPITEFIFRSLRHHVSNAQSDVELWRDELLMSVLTHQNNKICARAVVGIGMEELKTAIEECEDAGWWWEAAQLWFAASTPCANRSGEVLRRAVAAIRQVPETATTMALEKKIISILMYVTEGENTQTRTHFC